MGVQLMLATDAQKEKNFLKPCFVVFADFHGKYPYNGCLQAAHMLSLNLELGRDMRQQILSSLSPPYR